MAQTKVISAFLTLFILGILVVSGPANAFILGLVILDSDVNRGELIYFNADVELEEGENIEDINYLILSLNGPGNFDVECKFSRAGEIISGCLGMNISKTELNESDFGYGYGYGYGTGRKLLYNITLDTTSYLAGRYSTELKLASEERETNKRGEDLRISSEITSLEGCSLRGKDGNLTFDSITSTNNRINLHVPLRNAASGEGTLTSQQGNERFVYRFKVIDVLENDEQKAVLLVSGDARIGRERFFFNESLVYIDKIGNKLRIDAFSFELESMNIIFMRNC